MPSRLDPPRPHGGVVHLNPPRVDEQPNRHQVAVGSEPGPPPAGGGGAEDDSAPESGDAAGTGPSTSSDGAGRWSSERAAAVVFGLYIVVAVPVLLKLGSGYWFYGHDDWGLLTEHSPANLDDLFRPQHAHWSTVPILVFHGMFRLVGLHSYLPYQAAVVGLHLTLACLIRAVMRRVGVGPWVATVVAATFVLFSPGEQNILSAVQVSMVGSMVFGFTHLLLADHDGPADRRDGLGLAAGALGLMSSGIGVVLVVVVGLAALLRRGWKAAALHTAPLAALYGAWYLLYREDITSETANLAVGRAPLSVVGTWVSTGESGVLLALGRWPVVAVLIGVIGVVGLALAWIPLRWAEFRRRAAAPLALLAGSVILYVVITNGRWVVGEQFARSSRYIAMGTAFVLPALGVAADALIRWWRAATARRWPARAGVVGPAGAVVLLAPFVVAIPANATGFGESAFNDAYYAQRRQMVLGAAASPLAPRLPRDTQPDPGFWRAKGLTLGFLLDAKAAGKVPDPPPIDPGIADEILVRLSLPQTYAPPGRTTGCRTETGPTSLTLPVGTTITFRKPLSITPIVDGKPRPPVLLVPEEGNRLTVRNPEFRGSAATTWPGIDYTVCPP